MIMMTWDIEKIGNGGILKMTWFNFIIIINIYFIKKLKTTTIIFYYIDETHLSTTYQWKKEIVFS